MVFADEFGFKSVSPPHHFGGSRSRLRSDKRLAANISLSLTVRVRNGRTEQVRPNDRPPLHFGPRSSSSTYPLGSGSSRSAFTHLPLSVTSNLAMLESPQALIVAGLAVLITVSIVKWKTHPVSGVLRHSDCCSPDEALIAISLVVEVHSYRGWIFGPRAFDPDRLELYAQWEGPPSRGV